MAFKANAIIVLIASPSDTSPERASIQHVLNAWNVSRGEREGVVLVPYLYEQHAVPVMGDHPQTLLNKQAVDRADVVVAFFDAKLGTETAAAVSGTAEEIDKAAAAGKPVHVYFSNEPIPRTAEPEQLQRLADFRASLKDKSYYGTYEDPADLASRVVSAVDYDVNTESWALHATPGRPSGADIKLSHDNQREVSGADAKGRPKYRNRTNDLVVTNVGDRAAEGIVLEVQGDSMIHFEVPEPFDLTPTSESRFTMIALRSANVTLKASWTEDGEPREATRTFGVTAS
jgi:hypothetical protein